MIWALPAVVAFIGAIALFISIRGVAADASELVAEIERFSEVRQPSLSLRAEALALRADALELRARRHGRGAGGGQHGLAASPPTPRPIEAPAS